MTVARLNKKSGFTLIELLVVISIIAVLSVIGMAVFTGVSKGARDARRRSDVDAIAKALETTKVNGLYRALTASDFSSGSIPKDPVYNNCDIIVQPYKNMAAVGGCVDTTDTSTGPKGYAVCLRPNSLDPANDNFNCQTTSSFLVYFYVCTALETNTGNFKTMFFDASPTVGATYCRGNQL